MTESKTVKKKALSPKHKQWVNEFMLDFNATQATIRVGYSSKSARTKGSDLLANPDIKAEIEKRMKASKITAEEVVGLLGQMMRGESPTRITEYGSGKIRKDYDRLGAAEKAGRIFALFVDKHVIEIDGLEIIDDDEDA